MTLDETLYTKKGQPRKRRPKTSNNYFTEETEQAIIDYLNCEDLEQRNEIYNSKMAYAFYKLAENIIHTFKYYYNDTETIEEKKHEAITFVLGKLHLYRQSRGKAYSYFGTAIKRYLINENAKNYKKLQERVEINDCEELEGDNKYVRNIIEEYRTVDINDFMNQYIKYIDSKLDILFPKIKDRKIADAVMELFRKRETLEIFNKKALYIYIREIVDADTPQITRIVKQLKEIYIQLYNKYYDEGC